MEAQDAHFKVNPEAGIILIEYSPGSNLYTPLIATKTGAYLIISLDWSHYSSLERLGISFIDVVLPMDKAFQVCEVITKAVAIQSFKYSKHYPN